MNHGNTDSKTALQDADPALQTEVGRFLVAQGAQDYATKFYNEDYTSTADLSNETIDSIVVKSGMAAKLKRVLAAARAPAATKDPKAPTPIPDLPPGTTFDLTQTEITVPDVPPFTLPTALSVETGGGPIVSPDELSQADWMIIARRSKLVYAYTMEDFSGNQVSPPQASRPVLNWKIPDDTDFFVSEELKGTVTADVTSTQGTSNYIRCGFDSESANFGYAGCSASVERDHKERTANSSLNKTLQMFGAWYYPRAALQLDQCTAPSPHFVDAVTKAVASATPAEAMAQVFIDYGVAIPKQVTLGGQLYFVHSQEVHVEVDKNSVEDTIKAAVGISGGGASGSASATFQTATDKTVSAQNIHDNSTFIALGGDTTLASNPSQWAGTIKPANCWAVIAREGLRSVLDLLEEDLQQKALAIWDGMAPGLGLINDLSEVNETLQTQTSGFAMAAREASTDTKGAISLLCSKRDDPTEDSARIGGGACVEMNRGCDVWFDCNSVCLPVPSGYTYAKTRIAEDGTLPQTRFAFVSTKLRFGDWQSLTLADYVPPPDGERRPPIKTETDGFLFLTMDTGVVYGSRGTAIVRLDGVDVAATSVHYGTPSDLLFYPVITHVANASLCLPVPEGSSFTIGVYPTWGNPEVRAWWLPMTSTRWKFGPRKKRTFGSQMKAAEDGILHAMIASTNDGNRGFVRLRAGDDLTGQNVVAASASIHENRTGRHVPYASAMIPVRKGTSYSVDFSATYGSPALSAWWTAIVPV